MIMITLIVSMIAMITRPRSRGFLRPLLPLGVPEVAGESLDESWIRQSPEVSKYKVEISLFEIETPES